MTNVLHVSTLDGLMTALRGARGGETILLAGGDYGVLSLNTRAFPFVYSKPVTIASADPAAPAVFSGLNLRDVRNLAFDGVVFDYTFAAGQPIWHRPFQVSGTDIAIRNSVFDGDVASGLSAVDDGFGWGIGLSVRDTARVTLEGNEFFGFHRGLIVTQSRDITVAGNDVHSMRMDGMNFSEVQRVTIEDNHIHSFDRSKNSTDHADMIQFWTAGTRTPSTDIVIRNNTLDIGNGGYTQSIFIRNEMVDRGLAGPEMFYRNVLIEGNTIYNGHLHGISLGEAAGVVIRGNALLYADTAAAGTVPAPVQIPRINVNAASTDVTIKGNVTSEVTGWSGQRGWTVADNAFVQPVDPRAPGYYGDVFVTSSLAPGEDGRHDFAALPGGMIDRLGAGPAALVPDGAPGPGVDALVHVSRDPGNSAFRILDAGASRADGAPLPAGTTYLWTFADGTTASGQTVRHPFPEAGPQTASLSIRLPDGRSASAETGFAVAGSDVVTLGPRGFVAETFGADRIVAPLPAGDVTLGAPGIAASIDRPHLRAMFEAGTIDIGLTLAAARPGAAGEVFRLHGTAVAAVDARGELVLRLSTEAGEVRLITQGAGLGDTAADAVRIRIGEGAASVSVNGTEVGTAVLPAPLAFTGNHALTFGNPWGQANFAGTLSAFEIDIDTADHAAALLARDTLVAEQTAARSGGAVSDGPVVITDDGLPAGKPAPGTPEPDTGAGDPMLRLAGLDRFVLDIEALAAGTAPAAQRLVGDAAVVAGPGGPAIRLDGAGDHVVLGRLSDLEAAQRVGFSVAFTPDADNAGGAQRLVWNHMKIGATVTGEGVQVRVATATEGFKTFAIADAGITAGTQARLTVLLDTAEDRLQVLVDDRIALDHRETDFEIVGAGGREWGWTLGAPWNQFFDGKISDFRVGDRFEFLDQPPADPWPL